MKIENFKSGEYFNNSDYKSFVPTTINHEWNWEDKELNMILSQANKELVN